MATVYVATDLRLERRVAIKIMHGHLADDSQFKERFIQEARSAARLAHPNVVNVFDQGQDSDMAYLVMEYLPGITLRDLLQEHKVLTTEQTLDIMEAVLAGLAAAHKAGIVHRDLKPENVLLADDGRIKIGDFGLARAASANTATGAALLGTIAYLSPELVTRGIADTRSDIYAVGIMMYEMLVGEQPFKGEQPMQIAYQHATDKVPRPSARASGIPEELDELVLWATEREPDDRPVDAQAMLDRLREIERSLGVTPLTRGVGSTAGVPIVEDYGSGEVTRVLPGGMIDAAPAPVAAALDNSGRLRQRTRRRAGRGAALLVLVLLLAVAWLWLRRRWLSRAGATFSCSLRRTATTPSSRWVLGVARYREHELQWFPSFSLSLWPRLRFDRTDVRVRDQRRPSTEEAGLLFDAERIIGRPLNGHLMHSGTLAAMRG